MLQGCTVILTKHLLISAKFIKVYPGDHEEALPNSLGHEHELLGPLPGSMTPCCTGVQIGNTLPGGFHVLKRWKRVQWLYVEGKHCLALYVGSKVWGEKPQSSEAGGASRTNWAIFIPSPCQLKKVWAAQAPVLHVWQGPSATSSLH